MSVIMAIKPPGNKIIGAPRAPLVARVLVRPTGSGPSRQRPRSSVSLGARSSAMKRRRRARAAFHAAARLVEAVLDMPALPRAGADGAEQRSRGRAIACHIAREAFRLPIFEIAIAAGVDRRTASASTFRLWDRRDADADLHVRIEQLIISLRTMGESRKLLADAWTAGAHERGRLSGEGK